MPTVLLKRLLWAHRTVLLKRLVLCFIKTIAGASYSVTKKAYTLPLKRHLQKHHPMLLQSSVCVCVCVCTSVSLLLSCPISDLQFFTCVTRFFLNITLTVSS